MKKNKARSGRLL